MVELVRARRTPEELSREFEPSVQAIRYWVVQAGRDGDDTDYQYSRSFSMLHEDTGLNLTLSGGCKDRGRHFST
jgi:hypothetical protein